MIISHSDCKAWPKKHRFCRRKFVAIMYGSWDRRFFLSTFGKMPPSWIFHVHLKLRWTLSSSIAKPDPTTCVGPIAIGISSLSCIEAEMYVFPIYTSSKSPLTLIVTPPHPLGSAFEYLHVVVIRNTNTDSKCPRRHVMFSSRKSEHRIALENQKDCQLTKCNTHDATFMNIHNDTRKVLATPVTCWHTRSQ